MAHTDPKILKALCEALDYKFFDIYVHIDKRSEISLFDIDSYNLKNSNLYILENRINVRWGDISIVDATLNMYKQAAKQYDYCRYVTLSGLDFPIMSNEEIYKVLIQNEVEFIKGNPITKKETHKVENFYFWKFGKLGNYLTRILKLLKIKKRSKLILDGKEACIYFAPQWHGLSGEFVKYMLTTIEHNKIRKYFRFSYAPDELMIPTILFNCDKFKDRAITCDFPENTHYNKKTALHYLNYEPIIEVYDENSFDQIVNSGKMFVRKVTSNKSKKLIDLILEKTHNGNQN